MVINRFAGLVLPYTSKPLLTRCSLPRIRAPTCCPFHRPGLLSNGGAGHHLVLAHAVAFQGRQRLIAEMRRQVQRHVGLLSVSYYDENRTGTLVARIMSDVEGVRNLVGTGLVEFVGGLLTAVLAFLYLLHRSVEVTLTVFAVLGAFVFVLQYAFKIIRPIFRERAKSMLK